MASFNQNFTIYDLDRFMVRFHVVDIESSLDNDTNTVWWGVSTTPSPSPWGSDVKIQKTNLTGWYEAPPVPAIQPVPVIGGAVIYSSYIDIEIPLNSGSAASNQSGSVNLNPTFTDSSPVTYYHECVFADDGHQQGSTVIATGTLTVYESLFTKQGYRQ